MNAEAVLLVDNGSIEPAAALSLRRIAKSLGDRAGTRVDPVSMRHSDRIPAGAIGGIAAETIEGALADRAASGVRRITVVPLFFGPSGAVTGLLPEVVGKIAGRFRDCTVHVSPTLYQAGDARLARIIAGGVCAVAERLERTSVPRAVALVDHGSPVRELTAVRNALAMEVEAVLGRGFSLAPCSMERREGAEFDFNEPLLERLLAMPPWNTGDVIVAMQFLQPGRHAGPEGDIAAICREAEARSPRLRTHMTALVGESPLLIDILADRLRDGAAKH